MTPMRRLAALTAGLALALAGLVGGPTASADPSTEYICSMPVTPGSQSVTVGQNAYFSVQRNICSRSTGQFLYTDPNGTYWSSSDSSIASVGGATNYATMNLTVTTYRPGTVTITAIALCCDINYREVRTSVTLTVNPPPFSVAMAGPSVVRPNAGVCTWSVVPSNGTAPYTYAWRRNGSPVGTQATYRSGAFSSSFTLDVHVADALGRTAGASEFIVVSFATFIHC